MALGKNFEFSLMLNFNNKHVVHAFEELYATYVLLINSLVSQY